MKTLITGGPLFDGIKLHDQGSVLIENNVIKKIFHHETAIAGANHIHTQGDLIMPGIVDLHSDSLERSIERRKGVFFDVELAILNLDRQLAGCGITSFCHALSFADNELGLRSPKEAERCVRRIKAFQMSGQALIRHHTHIRYEVGSALGFQIIKTLVDEGLVDMISIMDHTPGQGQFKSMEAYMRFYSDEYDLPLDEIVEKATEKQEKNHLAWNMVADLAQIVTAAGIPILSHDDDTEDKINLIKSMGVSACEFPVTMVAAKRAKQMGLSLFMGAPNLVRDASTNGNLKASDLLKEGICTGLVSDYYPESLIQASFMAARHTGLETALSTVTSGPGTFLNAPGRPGFLTTDADADLIIVNQDHTWASIRLALVAGKIIFQVDPQPFSAQTPKLLKGA
jgi:alpha-D-ribose 1-methylphosphonate 5-triphosphate diphosphatase